MKFNYELAVIGFSMFLFYLRLGMLRGRKRRERREAQLAAMKGKNKKFPVEDPNQPFYQVRSWWLVGISMVMVLGGMAAKNAAFLPDMVQTYWWIITSVGVLLFAACFK